MADLQILRDEIAALKAQTEANQALTVKVLAENREFHKLADARIAELTAKLETAENDGTADAGFITDIKSTVAAISKLAEARIAELTAKLETAVNDGTADARFIIDIKSTVAAIRDLNNANHDNLAALDDLNPDSAPPPPPPATSAEDEPLGNAPAAEPASLAEAVANSSAPAASEDEGSPTD